MKQPLSVKPVPRNIRELELFANNDILEAVWESG